ncbi:aldo/keto reductase [Marinoscillum furvescens]|uniref:L-glyceraldehyde 3-phosphate reductase n=1 Tax=Marinoscillum furvescens DSM 4134 TaxID=1122208 RepID=A0A3D9L6Q9_MARFU|nr:aldo/keto reductase [Marinoscillum furvescens]REE01561.1 L-glyceraldehyde 3-phosphate reductase [Marinoscillum furvescens DSM 4134]
MQINDKSGYKKYYAAEDRYEQVPFKRCGHSGIQLPMISLGLWHNFGHADDLLKAQNILRTAFDLGVVHFDLANNYGPPFGAAETNFGRLFNEDFLPYRDELFISSKAGYDMWPGPYGNLGSRKYLISSLDQSLKRMNLDYVDLFYHHRPDPDTPLEETMGALDHIVRSGKALYVGISNYPADLAEKAIKILNELGTPCLIHQARYSMFDRWVEDGLLDVLDQYGVGCIAFSPLEQGMLTNKYVHGIPEDSRAAKGMTYLQREAVEQKLEAIKALHQVASDRGQSLSEMAIAWLLKDQRLTSVLVGVSTPDQLKANVNGLTNLEFSADELQAIRKVLEA